MLISLDMYIHSMACSRAENISMSSATWVPGGTSGPRWGTCLLKGCMDNFAGLLWPTCISASWCRGKTGIIFHRAYGKVNKALERFIGLDPSSCLGAGILLLYKSQDERRNWVGMDEYNVVTV